MTKTEVLQQFTNKWLITNLEFYNQGFIFTTTDQKGELRMFVPYSMVTAVTATKTDEGLTVNGIVTEMPTLVYVSTDSILYEFACR